ncbi:MerR family transcriptional regulator [Mycobacterium sp. Root265]|uniref:MerR family transcriptional regulator n=1 Tax=Mycobacterium sp. Root265 TaxID=1736504 RepID=UPI000A70796C|nr:MerR family transcriptional regulator [Mycobacterium sp. Root265]
MALNEYHLDDLARISGVTARNIRAYRERGLLDPPRRQGRSAIYDDYHLAQLQTIDELLGRGFTSAHVAEFFETMRAGGSVAELLGLQRAILRPRAEPGDETTPDGLRVKIDPASAEGARLLELGLAHRSGTALVFTNPVIGRVVARSADPLVYARIVLALLDASRDGVEALADDVISVLEREVVARYGSALPNKDNIDDMSRWITDCAGFSHAVIADHLQRALLKRSVTAVSDFNTGLVARGDWTPSAEGGAR